MRAPFKDPNKYCTFHTNTSTWRKDCRYIKWEIEHLLSDKYLRELVDGNKGL